MFHYPMRKIAMWDLDTLRELNNLSANRAKAGLTDTGVTQLIRIMTEAGIENRDVVALGRNKKHLAPQFVKAICRKK